MWRNKETQEFVDWLRRDNAKIPSEERTMFAGLDIYSMGESIHSVIECLEAVDHEMAGMARKQYGCLEPWVDLGDPAHYGRDAWIKAAALYEKAVVEILKEILYKRLQFASLDGDDFFNAEMSARLVTNSEKYYRGVYYGSEESWNQRGKHFFDTLIRLLEYKGPRSKVVVWAHSSHVGDARFTEMGMVL